MPENESPSSFQIAQAEWNACRLVHEFVNGRVRRLVELAATKQGASDADYFRDVLLRMLAWTHTLMKLREPADFQAVTVASRTLFENAVDVTILHFDPSNPPAKLLAWEASSKLKAGEGVQLLQEAREGPAFARGGLRREGVGEHPR